jgi:geranylgeranyl diphosphate synthase, type I
MQQMYDFGAQLARYKQAIDADIARYSEHVRKVTKQQYGGHPSAVTNEYLDLLGRGGKRIRGSLVLCGYEMLGGADHEMIVRAATAVEMLHAAMLIVDDIQDRDTQRRGKPAVHVALADYHQTLGLHSDAAHTGMSLALDAALSGAFAAEVLLAGLSVDAELRLKVVGIVNQTLVTTLHGQTYDVIHVGLVRPNPTDVAQAREWKSAHYTFLNPLCVGMVLAGAPCEDTDAIRAYALHTGIAFQLADDILDGDVSGQDVPAAIRESKRHVEKALEALDSSKRPWAREQVQFLRDLAAFVIVRNA